MNSTMKKALIHFIIVGFTLSLFTLGCKKYPEDDYLLTFRSTENRIKGSKKIEYAYSPVDSTNILSIYEDKFGPFYLYFSDVRKKSGEVYYVYVINANTHQRICITAYELYIGGFILYMGDGESLPCFTSDEIAALPDLSIFGKIQKCNKNELILSHAKFTTYAP